MRPFESTDEDDIEEVDERPIDSYPGYLGLIEMGDHNYCFKGKLEFMNEVKWHSHSRSMVDVEETRTFVLDIDGVQVQFNIDWDNFILAELLDKLPALDLQSSDGWWVVFARDGNNEDQVVEQVRLLMEGLRL